MTGRCSTCKETKSRSAFYKNQGTCKVCHAANQRAYRRTLRGFLDQKYTAMRRRVLGKDRNCAHLMKGLPIMPRAAFMEWAYRQPALAGLFETYRVSNWDFRLCPTIDRLDENAGYLEGNIRFLTQSENSARAWRPGHYKTRMKAVARGEKISGANWRAH